jgi:protein-arginine kinase activator protein McsA
MTPEEFYKRDKILRYSHEAVREMRVKSLSWMLECYRTGKIRKNTIINLIPLENLETLLEDMVERERYEDCIVIKNVIDEIYEKGSNS